MAKLDLALVVRTVDKATAPLRRIQKSVRDLSRRTGLDKIGRGFRVVGHRARLAADAVGRIAKKLALVATAIGVLIVLPALKAFATIESLEVAFESMLGSSGAAADMIKRLTEFSAKTPFQLAGIGRATKTLLAFGVEGDAIVGKLQFLGDIAAGAGVPLADLAQIYGKSMAKGKAQTEELNQLAERGVPILTALVDLAASYGNEISKEDVYKAAERGQIKFKAIEEALQLMTAEGGIFNEQMERQSETMSGLSSTVKDNTFLAFAELGEQIEETFSIKQGMRDFIVWLQNLTEELKKPREEQEGFARALTESLRGLKATIDGVAKAWEGVKAAVNFGEWIEEVRGWGLNFYRAILGWWSGVATFFRRKWEGVKAAVDFGAWIEEVRGWGFNFYVAITDWWSGVATFFRREWEKVIAAVDFKGFVRGIFGNGEEAAPASSAVPSLFAAPPVQGLPGPDALLNRSNPNASIVVDFRNMPRGTRTETRADSDVDLEVMTGYSMQGAQ